MKGTILPIHELQLYYELSGSGEPLLLLHRFSGCGEDWIAFRDKLAPDHQWIVPDLRGHGRSTNPSGQFTHRQCALDVLALLTNINPGAKFMNDRTTVGWQNRFDLWV